MAKKTEKVRRRKNSRFGPGTATLILYLICNSLFFGFKDDFGNLLSDAYKFIGQGEFFLAALIVISIVGTVILYFVPYLYGSKRMFTAQARRDAEVDLSAPNALFLRPFYWDQKMLFPNPFEYHSVPGFEEADMFGPEEFVGRVLEPYINVIQVGGGTITVGSGRLSVMNEGWQEVVIKAVQDATVTVVLPVIDRDEKTNRILGEGTLWELKYLVDSGCIARTIALLPMEAKMGWEQTRMRASEFGLDLPEHKKEGCIITFEYVSDAWRAASIFSGNSLATGLVEALEWLAERHKFKLLNR